MKRAFTLVVVPALAFTLGACGDDESPTSGHSMHTSASPSSATAAHNEQDVMFAQMMIPHHRQAIEMSDLAASRAASSEVKALAAQIKKAQGPEIEQLSGWLASWGAPASPSGMHHGGMDGMMTERQMKDLAAANGTAFDKAFLEMMIEHHEGAVEMAKTEQAKGAFPEAKAMAGRIISSQSAEIAEMRGLLRKM